MVLLLLLASTACMGKTMKFVVKPNQSFIKQLKEGPVWLDNKLHSQVQGVLARKQEKGAQKDNKLKGGGLK